MYKNKRIIAVSPVGRKRSMICLFKEILKHRHIIDEYHLWVNTNQPEDLEYINQFAKEHPNFVQLKYGCEELDQTQMGQAHNVKKFYNYCVEPDTFYFKIDDDIIYIEPNTFENMAQYKLDNPDTFLTFPVILNNYWCTHFLQSAGRINVPACEICTRTWYKDFLLQFDRIKNSPDTMSDDPNALKTKNYFDEDKFFSPLYWSDPHFAQFLLNEFLRLIKNKQLDLLTIPNRVLDWEPVSIQFIMWSGEDFARFNGNVRSFGDEPWLTMFYPIKYNLRNAIVGNVRVVHYAYWPQRKVLDQSNLLELYAEL